MNNAKITSQKDYEEIQYLRALWPRSEQTLEALRTVGSSSKEPDIGLLRSWQQRIVAVHRPAWKKEPDVHSPNGWFESQFPASVERYGPPFLEDVTLDREGFRHIKLIAINEDCFASIVGGDPHLGHRVVFFAPERTFYFYDPACEMFVPTTEEKLKLLVSNALIQCAQAMNSRFVDVLPLFKEYRSDDVLNRIIRKARAMGAASPEFFEENKRINAPVAPVVPRLFVQEAIVREQGHALTVSECYDRHVEFCSERGLFPILKREFKKLISELIHEEFGLGIRHDLVGPNGRIAKGWSGLSCREDRLAMAA